MLGLLVLLVAQLVDQGLVADLALHGLEPLPLLALVHVVLVNVLDEELARLVGLVAVLTEVGGNISYCGHNI